MKTVSQYKEEIKALFDRATKIGTVCSAEGRDFTPEEVTLRDKIFETMADYERIIKSIEQEEAISNKLSEVPQALTMPRPQRQTITVEDRAAKDKFNSFGQQMAAIMRAGIPGGRVDPRLLNAATGLSETVPSDGGFVVQQDFASEILKDVFQTGVLASRCRRVTISGNSNSIKINGMDETSRVAGLGFDGFQGYSPVAMARKSIGLAMAMETFGSNYFGNGTHPGVIVSHPGKLSEPAHNNLKADLTATYSGLGKSHKLLLLEEGMKMESVGVPPEDSQFLESRQFQIPEIARWFNLPPHKLKDLSRSSFNNIESEQISFVTDSILPWLIRLEQNFNMQLLTEREKYAENQYFKHIVEGLLRGDAKSRGEFYRAMFSIGAMSPNDVRAKEDADPIDGGDEYYVPLNMAPVSMLKEILLKNNNGDKETAYTESKPIQE